VSLPARITVAAAIVRNGLTARDVAQLSTLSTCLHTAEFRRSMWLARQAAVAVNAMEHFASYCRRLNRSAEPHNSLTMLLISSGSSQ